MSDLKTQPNEESVGTFLNSLVDQKQKEDSFKVLDMMQNITGEPPKMWGKSMIGFGSYHYKYESGREGDWFLTGFSPRKGKMSLYVMSGFSNYEALMNKLGKFQTGKSCLYIKKLDDIDTSVLAQLIKDSVRYMQVKYAG